MVNLYTKVLKKFKTSGLALFTGHAVEALRFRVRNASLGRRLGIRRVNIRSQHFITGLECIRIGENFDAGRGLWLEAISRHRNQSFTPKIVIGSNVSVSFWCHIAAVDSIVIGDNVMMGSKVLIIDHSHGSYGPEVNDSPDIAPAARALSSGPVIIGDNVWIGDGVVITPFSRIGNGCVIGANAVVTGTIPPNTIAVGTPARPIKRFDQALQRWLVIE